MFPQVYQLLHNAAPVAAIVGDRIGAHGEIPQDATRPYITYSTVSGQPFDQLSGTPCGDVDSIQIDCWHQTDPGIRALAAAVRAALDAALICNRVRIDLREPDTRLFRVGIEADFITNR
jgi:hypothetical protein